ncbi:hypothetical protein BH10BDE1_BH10BDE1_30050 [soil metagenome]
MLRRSTRSVPRDRTELSGSNFPVRLKKFRVPIFAIFFAFFNAGANCWAQETSKLKFPETVLKTEPDRLAFEIGHNATPTSYAMKAKTWTVGQYGAGYALSDSLFIATSPWIWASYNTMNLTAKWIKPVTSKVRAGFFAAYFQSYEATPFLKCSSEWACGGAEPIDGLVRMPDGTVYPMANSPYFVQVTRYQFQAAVAQALLGVDLGRFTVHSGLKYSYFFYDDYPYSLRMDPGDDAIRGQLDATVLIEHRLNERVRLNFEFGSLGLTDLEPYLHLGTSITLMSPRWLVQLGGSMTGKLGDVGSDTFWTPGVFDQRLHASREGQQYFGRYLTSAVHPEVQIQYFFE